MKEDNVYVRTDVCPGYCYSTCPMDCSICSYNPKNIEREKAMKEGSDKYNES